MNKKVIDGSRVIYEFTILHDGWEMDNRGWVTKDGRIFTTSHGGPYEMEIGELEDEVRTHAKVLGRMLAAKELSRVRLKKKEQESGRGAAGKRV